MQNVFPANEIIEFEEIYGSKRESSSPPECTKTYTFNTECKSTFIYTTPRQYKWFMDNKISIYEERAFTDMPVCYLDIRNRIIEEYKKDLPQHISLTSTYKKMKEYKFYDVYRIYSFLDKLDIINRQDAIGTSIKMLQEARDLTNGSDMHESRLENSIKSENTDYKHLLKAVCGCGSSANFYSTKNFICCDCLTKGKYPAESTASDFKKIRKDAILLMWSKREEILLLEGIDKYKDDWNMVADHVGTKSKQDCIYHFLMIPIVESDLYTCAFDAHMPFMLSSNPITHIIAYLCSEVHPSVAASVAKLVVRDISKSNQNMMKMMLLEAKEKCKEILLIEEQKIKRIHNVCNESLLLLISMKAKHIRVLYEHISNVREELIETLKKISGISQ